MRISFARRRISRGKMGSTEWYEAPFTNLSTLAACTCREKKFNIYQHDNCHVLENKISGTGGVMKKKEDTPPTKPTDSIDPSLKAKKVPKFRPGATLSNRKT
jgi:hypothetical protein